MALDPFVYRGLLVKSMMLAESGMKRLDTGDSPDSDDNKHARTCAMLSQAYAQAATAYAAGKDLKYPPITISEILVEE